MFGYVKPQIPELKVSEYVLYRAVYCGLCRVMGTVTGQLSRLTLSYDLVFLAAVRMILTDITPETATHGCLAHPFEKRTVVIENEALRFTAAMSALLVGAKNRDDRDDEAGLFRLKATLLTPFCASISRRASRRLPSDTDARLLDSLSRLRQLEEARCTSADETAAAFGETLALAFSLGLSGACAETAKTIGYHAGRFVYLCDAVDDLAEDVKKNRYNPLAVGWGALALEDGKISPIVRDSVCVAAPLDLEPLGAAVETLNPVHPLTPLVKNITYLGMTHTLGLIADGKPRDNRGRIRL